MNNSITSIESILSLATQASKYCVGMEGNISVKINDSEILIKASGAKLSNLTSNDLVGYSIDGEQLSNYEKKGSMELSFHLYLLGYDSINYVSHTHPINTLKILCTNRAWEFSNIRLFPDQVIFNGKKSCLVPYAKPGIELTESIKKHLIRFLGDEGYFPKLILLENHGIITCGASVDECVIANDICEKAAEIFIGSISLGSYVALTKGQIIDLTNDNNEKYRQDLLK